MGRPKGARGGRMTMVKDPNKPKRPTSAYFFFAQHKRLQSAAAGNPVTRVADFTKLVSQEWRTLTNDAKKPFDEKARIDKARYDNEMANYKGRKNPTKDPNKPKRPCSAYFIFLADFRVNNKMKYSEHKDLIKAAGAAWQDMSEHEKKPYEMKAEIEKKKYTDAIASYNKGEKPLPHVEANGEDDDEYDDDEEEDD